jgi:prolyl-tRNA synthetase
MRVSNLFTKTRKEVPADEQAKNAQWLIKAGYIHKDSAGVYLWLPLGFRVLNKIMNIIREEMDAIGGQEVVLSNLQRQELWEITDRWDDEKVDVWFKTEYKNGARAGLAWSHEEQMTDMMRHFVSSHRDLPAFVYQFQNKLRNETRAKSGIMRTREFIMKDMYSFVRTEEDHKKFYDQAAEAYLRLFDRLGLGEHTFFTFASGGAFAEFSHEFQTICDAGEDTIYLHRGRKLAVNQEVLRDDVLDGLGLKREELEEVSAAEVGNIFSFGTSKSEPLGLSFTDEDGHERFVVMGSYGIGPARVMGVITELFSDDKGLVWPENIAPYKVYLVSLVGEDSSIKEAADKLYEQLRADVVEVLYDDRDVRAGEKFADADLLGIPYRVVVSAKTLAEGKFEFKARNSDKAELVNSDELKIRLSR